MKKTWSYLGALALGLGLSAVGALAQTEGAARLEATLLDYNGSGTRHWTVVWVATSSGTFIKTLWKQGPTIGSSHWASHCATWYNAKAGSTALDGYSSATAQTYAGTNSPVILTWDGLNATGTAMADGDYKFWVQYAEDSGQGPYTTSGLLWTKGPSAATNTYPNQGANFANLRVTWTPTSVPTVAPTITSAAPTPTGMVGTAYSFTCTATGTMPITFTASGLPPGLSISPTGKISGTPTTAGSFPGTIQAANGTLPDDTQVFTIAIAEAPPVSIASVQAVGSNLILSGTGPANRTYYVLTSSGLAPPSAQWTAIATNAIDGTGNFSYTVLLDAGASQKFIKLQMP